jgi:hypothetical protein
VGIRAIRSPVISESIVHRAEPVPDWQISSGTPAWRALCGAPVGRVLDGGRFQFDVAVALDPEAWRLAANCTACRAATERRALGALRR